MAWTERNTGLIKKWWLTGTLSNSDIRGAWQFMGAKNQAKSYDPLVGSTSFTPFTNFTFSRDTGIVFDGSNFLALTGFGGTGVETFLTRTSPYPIGDKNTLTGYVSTKGHWIAVEKVNPTTISITARYNATTTTPPNYTVNNANDITIGMARNRLFVNGEFKTTIGSLDTWIEQGTWRLGANISHGVYIGDVKAHIIYGKQLTDDEMGEISTNVAQIGSNTNLSQYVNHITQNPATKHLNNAHHELLIATEGGVYQTINGGRSWTKITLPDPSNAEFADSPAATVDELSFRWIAYDPSDNLTLYAMAAKSSVSRFWIYKSTDLGDTWASRGVDWA